MKDWLMILIIVTVMCLEVGNNTLVKASTSKGMSNFVFVVYSNAIAMFFLIPITFIFHKIKPIPPISFPIIFKIFLLALFSLGIQICMYVGIGYSSPTLSSAIINLTPAFAFVLAIISRMEKLEMKSYSSQAKLMGTIVSIAGAFVVNFYKGPKMFLRLLFNPPFNDNLLSAQSNWIFGGFLSAVSAFLMASSFIIQAWILKDYPSEVMVTIICCIFVTIQSTVVALVVEKHLNAWKIAVDLQLVTIFYSAVVMICLRSIVYTWVVRLKGPVFVTIFKPLEMVIAVVLGVLFLGDDLYIGSVIGAAVIAVGFYSVVWGKANESKAVVGNEISTYHSSSNKAPLLQSRNCTNA